MNKGMALMLATHYAMKGAREYLEAHDFIDTSSHMPILVGVTGACENVNTLYKVESSSGKPTFLAQSDQLYLEIWTPEAPSGKLYCVIPSSRNELEVDSRHLNQFPLLELEMLGDLTSLMDQIEQTVKSMARGLLSSGNKALAALEVPLDHLRDFIARPIHRISYRDAIFFLQKHGFPELAFGDDLKHNHEMAVAEVFGPTFITHYPLEIKFFNMKQNASDKAVVNSCDLILPLAGESTGAAEREHDYDTIVRRLKSSSMYALLKSQGVSDKDFDWYLNAHLNSDGSKKAVPLHSGCGIGVARVMQFLLLKKDIHEVMVYPIDAETVY